MAAVIVAIKKKQAAKKQGGARVQPNAEEEDRPPDWATNSSAGKAWNRFWARTTIDDKFWSQQERVSKAYLSTRCQAGVAALICGNFIMTMTQMTVDPRELRYNELFYGFSCFFNIAFLIELLVNLYAHWFWKFWWAKGCTWNWFDVTVVILGMLDVFNIKLGPLKLLRNLRAFRVFRLFKRIKALNKILQALFRAVSGVSSAFVVISIVMAIFAILGVSFFKDVGSNGTIVVEWGDYDGWYAHEISGLSSRGIPIGEEYFGNFGRALFTMFQLLLGDSWAEIVGRTIIWGDTGWGPALGVAYIVLFMLTNAVVLTNVVVAVLLEKVIDDGADEEDEKAGAQNAPTDELGAKPGSPSPQNKRHGDDHSKERRKSKRMSTTQQLESERCSPVPFVMGAATGDVSATVVEEVKRDMLVMVQALQSMQVEMATMRKEQKEMFERALQK